MPTRKEVPGIRAVFFLTFLIPIIALASYYYNLNISEEVIEEVEIIQQSTTTSSTTTIETILQKQYPIECSSSSSYNDGDGWSVKIYTMGNPHLGRTIVYSVKTVGLNLVFHKNCT